MLTLRCDEPVPGWEGHVLPIGNGALGACVFGALATERVQLDEKPLRTGGPGSAGVGRIRQLADGPSRRSGRRTAGHRRAGFDGAGGGGREVAAILGNPSYSTVKFRLLPGARHRRQPEGATSGTGGVHVARWHRA
ncbi:glycoside hydrolase N-terminal domain-containing protein [Nonomuraea sp. NPDC001831]|uniref:glycoside hydrolase N-terminal domain-containing protein n=1 Tax=Nonomuraea sp. NPDC001831 TaxID=3364340 RepID=UPI0036BC8414